MDKKRLHPNFMASRKQVEESFGYPSRRALELFAVNGGGPKITRIGKRCLYRIGDVEDWLRSFETVQPGASETTGTFGREGPARL